MRADVDIAPGYGVIAATAPLSTIFDTPSPSEDWLHGIERARM
jgi:hypothetical protein